MTLWIFGKAEISRDFLGELQTHWSELATTSKILSDFGGCCSHIAVATDILSVVYFGNCRDKDRMILCQLCTSAM